MQIEDDETMVSFDVEALFPSIPVDVAIESLKLHLETKYIEEEKRRVYLKAAKVCMSQNCFVFRDKFYKSNNGTSMGNPLSPLIAEAFMSKFEMDLRNEGLLPKIGLRYVDDVFSVIKKNMANDIIKLLNNRFDTINFTFEEEDSQNCIPFLDVLCKKRNNKIEFDVFRKNTTTDRYITKDSFCSYQHKIAAFHSMAHRLCKLPLSIGNFKKEFDFIVNLADVNGFGKSVVEKIVKKQSDQIRKNEISTLFSQNETTTKFRVSFSYIPAITNKLRKTLEKENIHIAYNNNGKLKNILGSTKDLTPTSAKSGIYEINCSDCNKKYIGQTKRSIKTRFKEHISCIKNKQINRSSVAAHVFAPCDNNEPPHNIGPFEESVRLLKSIRNERKLDAYESLFISKSKNCVMNTDNGNILSPLFALV